MTQVLGREPAASSRHDLEVIARRAMLEHGLLPDFEPPVLAQLQGIVQPATMRTPPAHDLRGMLWSSIDNDDSLDLDQVTVAESLRDGRIRILVAIADVDAVARKGSAIDAHAEHNTTSVYTAAAVFPMLPEKLSTDLTSLVEGQDRLAVVIEIVIAGEGIVGEPAVYPAVVRNHAKLAYSSVGPWLDGQGPVPPRVAGVPGLAEQLRLQDLCARALMTQRSRQGALTLQTIQTRAVFDGDLLTDLRPEEHNRAKALIENLMVAANGATIRYLEAKRVPAIRRILRVPERWDRLVTLAASVGERLPPVPDAGGLEAFLAKRQQADPLRFPDLSLSVIKLLGSGEYVIDLPGQSTQGHFGLAVSAYTHSTAPNRRFPDLVTQRLLKATLTGDPTPYDQDLLGALARHCTEQEDNARKVERQVEKSAAALLLVHRIGQRFEGVITGASEKGTWVRIFQPPVEGRVVRGFQGLDVGDRVGVELVGADVDRGFIDFAAADRLR